MSNRLYTEAEYLGLRDGNIPEIRRSNLASVLLQVPAVQTCM